MRALTWHGVHDVRVDNVPDPEIVNPRDCILKVTSTAICGSDLHLYDGVMPSLKAGDILGHEFMGEVVEVGPGAKHKLSKGDRVIIPFTIACGNCFFCEKTLFSCCDNSNTANAQDLAETLLGHSPVGLFGYTHMLGGYAGGQAEYVRVPVRRRRAVQGAQPPDRRAGAVPDDVFPTGYMAAEHCDIEPGDTVAIWGCGPVGQFAIRSAFLLGAERVIAIDHYPERLALARQAGAETLNYHEVKIREALTDMTAGRGPDSVIDGVGMEAHGYSPDNLIDLGKMAVKLATDRGHVLRECILAVRKGGHVSVPGVYGGMVDKFPMGAVVNKALTIKSGQTHVHRYLPTLLDHIENGRIDPTEIITHRMPLEDAPKGYKMFKEQQDEVRKVVLKAH
jgi:threonine dehydrogenase-like Zn-dependent dehydrogenase